MPRPRTPTAILELKGSFRHNPNRRRTGEPKEDRSLGDAPGRLPADVIPYWNEIVDMVAGGVLTYRDRWAVELCARLMEKATRQKSSAALLELIQTAELESNDVKALLKQEVISSAELSTLRSLLAALGMTPADRSKLHIAQETPKENAFADLDAPIQ